MGLGLGLGLAHLDDSDAVGVADGRETVRDHEHLVRVRVRVRGRVRGRGRGRVSGDWRAPPCVVYSVVALTARRSVLRSLAARSAAESKYCTCGKTSATRGE